MQVTTVLGYHRI